MANRVAAAVTEMQSQQTAAVRAHAPMQAAPATPTPRPTDHQAGDVDMSSGGRNRTLRKMDSKPPTFDGDIDGVKLNSFIFQFESYFTFKGYDLELEGTIVGLELGQCVRKSAITWYETYMQRPDTMKTWSAMKYSLQKNFKEPNFQQKMRTTLLNIKQRGAYHGYVAKFQEQLRLVPLEPTFAKEIFLKGLTSANLRKQILRKNPQTLEEVIAEGFAEEALEEESKSSQAFTPKKSSSGEARDTKENRQNLQNKPRPQKSKCINCHRGFHKPEDCWVKFPEKRPTKPSDRKPRSPNQPPRDKTDYKAKYYALIDKLVVDDNDSTPASLNE